MTNSTQAIPASNAIVYFAFEDHEVRGFEYAGEPYFVGNEVAAALGYASPKDAVSAHCKSLKLLKSGELALLGIPCGPRGMNIIPERDVYRLVMRSNLPTAEAFEEKVVGEILPAIRKTGSYGAEAETIDPMAFLNDPAAMRAALLGYTEKVIALESVNAELAPKAAAHDHFAELPGELGVRDAGRELKVGQTWVCDYIDAHGWSCVEGKKRKPAHYGLQKGYVRFVRKTYPHPHTGEEMVREEFRITHKGLNRLAEIIAGKKEASQPTVRIVQSDKSAPVPFSRPKEAAS